MIAIAVACLALASFWRAALVLSDFRRIRRVDVNQRMYRPEFAWTNPNELNLRRRSAWLGLSAAPGLMPVAFFSDNAAAETAAMLSCGGIIVWILGECRLYPIRVSAVCIGILASDLLLYQAARFFTHLPATLLAGMFASFFASQLYLATGIRKLQSTYFMSGRVIVDNLAYGIYQSAAGNREFIRLASLPRLADLLSSKAFLSACRLGAILTAAVELAIGLGALGLFPAAFTFSLAIPSHLAFILISPYRIVPFAVAALGLVAVATTHPILAGVL